MDFDKKRERERTSDELRKDFGRDGGETNHLALEVVCVPVRLVVKLLGLEGWETDPASETCC